MRAPLLSGSYDRGAGRQGKRGCIEMAINQKGIRNQARYLNNPTRHQHLNWQCRGGKGWTSIIYCLLTHTHQLPLLSSLSPPSPLSSSFFYLLTCFLRSKLCVCVCECVRGRACHCFDHFLSSANIQDLHLLKRKDH